MAIAYAQWDRWAWNDLMKYVIIKVVLKGFTYLYGKFCETR